MIDYAAQGIQQLVRVQLLDRVTRAELAQLDGARSLKVNHNLNRTPRGGGDLIVDVREPVTWSQTIVRLWVALVWRGEFETHPMLTAYPTVAGVDRTPGLARVHLTLKDLTVRLDDQLGRRWAYPEGQVVTDAVRQVFALLGISGVQITDHPATLRSSLVWQPDDTYRRMLTDLLDAIGYAAPWTTTRGVFVCQPYVLPADRPEVLTLEPGPSATHRPELSIEQPTEVPNHFVLIGRGDGENDDLVAEGWNDDPASPYSTANQRAIPYSAEVDAVDQATLDAQLARIMAEYRQPPTKYTVRWRYRPVAAGQPVEVGNAIRLRAPSVTRAGVEVAQAVDTAATIESQQWSWQDGGPLSEVEAVVKEVAGNG